MAKDLEKAQHVELMKQKKDQERRRVNVDRRTAAYLDKVAPALEEKKQKQDQLLDMYVKQREEKLDNEAMRQSQQKEMYKSNHFLELKQQTKANQSQVKKH